MRVFKEKNSVVILVQNSLPQLETLYKLKLILLKELLPLTKQ